MSRSKCSVRLRPGVMDDLVSQAGSITRFGERFVGLVSGVTVYRWSRPGAVMSGEGIAAMMSVTGLRFDDLFVACVTPEGESVDVVRDEVREVVA